MSEHIHTKTKGAFCSCCDGRCDCGTYNTMQRFESHRFKFDASKYEGGLNREPMTHIRIYAKGAMQVDLWLTMDDLLSLYDAVMYGMERG